MSRATELKGIRDSIDALAERVGLIDQRACQDIHLLNLRVRDLPRTARCRDCALRDFVVNMEEDLHGQCRHTVCRLKAEGAEVCAHCAGKGEVKKAVARKAKKKGKANASS